MQSLETLSVFTLSSLVLAITPGPDNLFVLAQSVRQGKTAGVAVTLGLCSGLFVHTLAVILGLATLFQVSALAFNLVKYFGAAYLLYLAYHFFLTEVEQGQSNISVCSFGKLYRRGILMNISNPKVSLFFLAFLPQFTDPQHGSLVAQFALLGGLFIVATIIVFGAISVLAGQIGQYLRTNPKVQIIINRCSGMVFLLLACNLLFAKG